MKQQTSSFSRHLIGGNRLERPAFFGAYLLFWIHASACLTLAFIFSKIEIYHLFSLIIMESCAFGFIAYGVFTRQSQYIINIFSYMLVAVEIWNGPELGRPFSIAALVILLNSFYMFFKEQVLKFKNINLSNISQTRRNWLSIAFLSLVAIIAAIFIRFNAVI
jgi:hypothetical protein